MPAKKQLTRSKTNKTVAGILGGIAEYYDIDPVLIRAAYVLITAFSGFAPGIIAYIGLLLVIPEKQTKSDK